MKSFIILILTIFLFANDCNKRVFTIHLKQPIKFSELLSEISNECNLNIIVKDDKSEKIINSNINFVNVENITLKELLNTIFDIKHLFYKIKGDKLYISYYKTKTFKLDFIPNSITGNANVNADDNSIQTNYSFDFWKNLKNNITNILSNIDKDYKQPVIDKDAGLITITANKLQMDKIEEYLRNLNERLHKEVLIDVKIYSVSLSSSHKTGIDWNNFSLELSGGLKGSASRDFNYKKDTATSDSGYEETLNKTGDVIRGSNAFILSSFNINGFLNFLAQNGNVNSISNPKIATLNNQKALIRIGDTVYYKYANKVIIDNNGNPTASSYTIESKFVGVVLDITPQISDNGTIILSINPRISKFENLNQLNDTTRDMPPDTKESSLISVVRMKDNQTLVLGGLITDDRALTINGVPVLKEIPLIKYLFSSREETTQRKELVFVITPHVIDLNSKKTLKDFGYGKLPNLEDLNVR